MKKISTFLIAQLGPRRHYAIPRALEHSGMLYAVITDAISNPLISSLSKIFPRVLLPKLVRRFLARSLPDIPKNKIKTFNLFAVEYYIRKVFSRDSNKKNATYLWAGNKFCKLVINNGFGTAGAFYGFNSASLEIMAEAKKLGLKCILDQTIAPRSLEEKLIRRERNQYPKWEPGFSHQLDLKIFIKREKEEWDLADLIICGSDFVKQGIKKAGGPFQKCVVVPSGVETTEIFKGINSKFTANEPLKLLTVGAVGIRKGAPRILEMAKAFQGRAKFRWVGPIEITPYAKSLMEPYIELTGQIPRSEINQHFAWADAFILLSICEGSAEVIYEALAKGIPVICSDNSGAPKFKSNALIVVSSQSQKQPKEAIEKLIALKRNNRYPVVSNDLRKFVSLNSYFKRIVNSLKAI